MMYRRVSISVAVAALLVQSIALAFQSTETATPKRETIVVKTAREFRSLRGRARTPEEFGALSQWCDLQAGACRRKQAGYEQELREYYAHPPAVPRPKYPARSQTLSLLIAHCKEQAEHWSELAELYSGRTKPSDTAAAEK